jgi:purine-nucleoside phosphorylase
MPSVDALASLRHRAEETAAAVAKHTALRPAIGVILGSGLGGLAKALRVEAEIPYAQLPHLPEATAPGHEGTLVLGTLGAQRSLDSGPVERLEDPRSGSYRARQSRAEVRLAVMAGRFHYYEGYTMAQVTFPIRLLHALGCSTLVLTSIVGSMRREMPPGTLVLLEDHINLMGANPLLGPNDDSLGPRFPDMSMPYDAELRRLAMAVAAEQRLPLREGVYAALAGPNLETRAEYRMLRQLGADVVGMSMVPEVLVARHAGLRVLAVVVVSDACIPEELKPASVEELLRVAAETEPKLTALLTGVIARLT